jgi:hypothetical protein
VSNRFLCYHTVSYQVRWLQLWVNVASQNLGGNSKLSKVRDQYFRRPAAALPLLRARMISSCCTVPLSPYKSDTRHRETDLSSKGFLRIIIDVEINVFHCTLPFFL